MGDDPAFLTALQNRLTVVETDRITATTVTEAIAVVQNDVNQNEADIEAALAAYQAEIEERNLQLMLAYDTPVYIDTLFGG